ncbi:hypothetical protein [Geobacter sp. AOG1]|uniref:acyltransferase n=1 Tax=Geobacter sp. AOG1 TaxID=1566346 RepID=UPI001CC61B4B|nr:hypothetical protein [Geobacter sp. AOG1]GFE58369.1 hypothetical protein AOG1_22490 [Geobacter sp. AOG1]
MRTIFQILAFFLPAPFNVWLHRLAGAKIDRYVSIHMAVLILAKNVEIKRDAKIKFGTMLNVRTFKLGRKSSIGFFTLAKGESDLLIGDACIIGPKCMINCSRQVVLDFYSGVGPGSYLYTHGSGMPVTEGYRSTFAPIHIKEKVWVNMRCTIGPGVTIERGSIILPGTNLIESVAAKRMVVGDPAKLSNFPVFLCPRKPGFLEKLANEILEEYGGWMRETEGVNCHITDGIFRAKYRHRDVSISVGGNEDIILCTSPGERREGMYFNLADLTTDESRHPIKLKIEAFMRLRYGLIFL